MTKGSVKEWQHQTSSPMCNVNGIRNDTIGRDTKESKIVA